MIRGLVTYEQSTGQTIVIGRGGVVRPFLGYSGAPGYINEGGSETAASRGPIPRGRYRIGDARHHIRLGTLSLPLEPIGHDAHGRSGFYVHGDNPRLDRSASSGCIILGRTARQAIIDAGASDLIVW